MEDNKLIDLHKVAGLFREIQTEEFAKEEAKEQSEFKKTVEALETTEQEVVEELTAAQKKLPAGLRDAIAKKQGDSTDDEVEEEKVEEATDEVEEATDEVEESSTLSQILKSAGVKIVTDADLNQPEAEAQPVEEEIEAREAEDWQMPKVDKNTPQQKKHKFSHEPGWSLKKFAAINIDTGEHGFVDKDELDKFTHMIPTQEFTYFDTEDHDFSDFDDAMADQEGWTKIEANQDEAVTEEPVAENPEMVAMDTNTLQQILNLAGVKAVTDADINQPEAGAQPVEEYSNSPDEEYADTDTQLNKMSGGINRPKAMPAVGNDGHNRLVMKLKKAYSDIE
tara:strand:- start:511 stop:1521 length:1011 start_codon:yes stop_codon:yes gene_type:complete